MGTRAVQGVGWFVVQHGSEELLRKLEGVELEGEGRREAALAVARLILGQVPPQP